MFINFIIFITFITVIASPSLAQEIGKTIYAEGVVREVLQDKVRVEVVDTSLRGRVLETKSLANQSGQKSVFHVGDKVTLSYGTDARGNEVTYIIGFVRTGQLLLLFFVFVVLVFIIGRWQGALSLVGMILSVVVISRFIVPQILLGSDPVVVALLGSLIIIPLTFYVSHGLNNKTTIAVIGTFLALILTGLIAYLFVFITKLTGFAAEEATYVQFLKPGTNIQSLLLAGIIIGTLGILDDITISQTGIVEKLKEANTKFTKKELYFHAMDLGRDHIASLVNTLILVYAGASLPLFILFYNSGLSYSFAISQEMIATEIVRTLVSSIGIITAVPITTLLAVYLIKK